MQLTHTPIDDTHQELTRHGTPEFPIAYYHDVIDQYDIRSVDWHWHVEVEFTLIEHASIRYHIDGTEFELEQGEGIFINSNVLHRLTTTTGGTAHNFVLAPEFIAPVQSDIYRLYVLPVIQNPCPYLILRDPDCVQALGCLYDAFASNTSTRQLEIHARTEDVWTHIARKLMKAEDRSSGTLRRNLAGHRVQLMIGYMQSHLAEHIALGDIADAAQISKSEALRCFRSVLGTTPIAYLIGYRLDTAADLLAHGESSVSSLAEHLGFESTSYFCRMFKRRFGLSPLRYRSARRA